MKKNLTLTAMMLSILSTTGCMGTKNLSHDITSLGTVKAENIVFPELDKAWQKEGQFPNRENLSKIRPGVAKDELYQLIGRPHFSEAQHAREWDYILKFYQLDDSVKVCQYKVIFDKDYKGQEFYWKPADCADYAKVNTAPVQNVVVGTPLIQEKINLSADALFHFDKYRQQDMLPQGQAKLDELAQKLNEYGQKGNMQVLITGHTDRFGDDVYNSNLSLLRAQTVRSYLINRGVDASTVIATGAGESQPIKQCSEGLSKQQAIDCLQPNRRVEVAVSVYQR